MAQSTVKAPVTIHVGAIPSEVAGELFYGIDMGFFKKAGLDVDIQFFNNGGAIAAAVASGALDLGLSDLMSVINAHAHGLPFVYAAPGLLSTIKPPTFGLLIPPNSPIHEAKDFDGKTVAVSGLRNIPQIAASAWIDANGGDSSTVSYVEIPFPAQPAALAAGRVDGISEVEPFFGAAAKDNRVLYYGYSAISKHFLLNLYVTTPDWAKAHPDLVTRFASVIHETAVWANKNHDQSGPMLAKYTNIPADTIAAMVRGHYAEELTPAIMQPGIDASAKYNSFATFPASTLLLPGTK